MWTPCGKPQGVFVLVGFLLAAILAASCGANSPLSPTPPAPRVDLQFGRGFGFAVDLLNGTPIFYQQSAGFYPARAAQLSTHVILYAVDKDGVYEDVTTQAEIVSSSPLIAIGNPPLQPPDAGYVPLRPVPGGQVTITANYSGMSSSLTFMVAGVRPPSLEASFHIAGAGHEISYDAWVVVGGSSHTTLVPGVIQWSSSDPGVVSASGSTLRANAPGTADLTMRYDAVQASYRITIPPFARLAPVADTGEPVARFISESIPASSKPR